MVRFAFLYFAAPAFVDFVAADLPIHVGRIARPAGVVSRPCPLALDQLTLLDLRMASVYRLEQRPFAGLFDLKEKQKNQLS